MSDLCSDYLREHGKAYPRTCAECGLGPCSRKMVVQPQCAACGHDFKSHCYVGAHCMNKISDVAYCPCSKFIGDAGIRIRELSAALRQTNAFLWGHHGLVSHEGCEACELVKYNDKLLGRR